MLNVKRHRGEQVLLADGGGKLLRIKVSDVVLETGFVNLHVRTATNHFAVTLAPGRRLPLGPTVDFAADVDIVNATSCPTTVSRAKLTLDIPPQVTFLRDELVEVVH